MKYRWKRHSWTDDNNVTHLTKPSGFITFCEMDVPTDYNGGMPGWPPPPARDYELKPITCLACTGEEHARGIS